MIRKIENAVQQLDRDQQNEQSHLTLNHSTLKRTQAMKLEI